ncbi:hypothetical protein VTJ49DRAFT_3866 [Mycothermus thermophilus]|uniref:Nicotianamine synthase n=1 Tax=Humicola insolens TaxID=85995 RepID=A0ABR3VRE9_HUMIN
MSLFISWLRLGSPTKKMDPCPCASHDSIDIVEKDDILRDQRAEERAVQVQNLVRRIVDTHTDLLRLPHLRPGKIINKLLGDLVTVCSDIYDREVVDAVLSHPGVNAILPSLRQICAQAESCLELHWAEHIVTGGPANPDDVLSRLRSFPYYDNYEELTRLELCAILSATKSTPRRVAFIGSGPLPLTSLCLLQALKRDVQLARLSSPDPTSDSDSVSTPPPDPDPIVLNIDCDASAIAASLTLCLALGDTARGMEFVCAEATAPILPASSTPTENDDDSDSDPAPPTRDLAEFDLVYMAALVGMSQADKERIVRRIAERMRPGALLVARSSWGMRTCLYPEVDLATEGLRDRLECCVVVHPYGQVVNSVIVARVRG